MDRRKKSYWYLREKANLQANLLTEKEKARQLDALYQRMSDNIAKEINAFYSKYAVDESISMSDAKKRASKMDVEAFGRKVEGLINDRNLSPEAKEQLRLYNLTMKVNRLELLKANMGVEAVKGYDDIEKHFDRTLNERAIKEYRRQAGILGNTIVEEDIGRKMRALVTASYHNATWSERIWNSQSMLKADLDKELQRGLIQGMNPLSLLQTIIPHVDKSVKNARAAAETLMRTEMARLQTDVQMQSYREGGWKFFEFISVETACPACKELDGKHFKVDSEEAQVIMPPVHPNCRCSTAPWEDDEEYEAWLNYLANGGSTEEWNEYGRDEWLAISEMYRGTGVDYDKAKEAFVSWADGEAYDIRFSQQIGHDSKEAQYIEDLIRDSNVHYTGELHRGIMADKEMSEQLLAIVYGENEDEFIFDMLGTSSWSRDESVAENFAFNADKIGMLDVPENERGNPVIFHVNLPDNDYAIDIDMFAKLGQKEVLLSKDAKVVGERISQRADGVIEVWLSVE